MRRSLSPLSIVVSLLALLNPTSFDGMTPITVARAIGHKEVADLLKRHSARH